MTQHKEVTNKIAISSTARQPHLAYIDGLRALAAIYVVLFHALIQVEPGGQHSLGKVQPLSVVFTFGHQAVDLFIVISGFCLMLPVVRHSKRSVGSIYVFFKKRARRILPTYFIALTLTFVATQTIIGNKTGTGWDVSIPVTMSGLISHALLLQDISSSTAEQINGAFWSISVEWRIYLVFPLLVFVWRKFGALRVVLLSLIISLVFLYALHFSPIRYNVDATVGIMPQYLSLFCFGMLGAEICFSNNTKTCQVRERIAWMPITCVIMSLVLVLCKLRTFYHLGVPTALIDIVAGLCAMTFLVSISVSKVSTVRNFLSSSMVSFIGTFAYSIYLIHAPIQQVIWQYVLHPLNMSPLTVFIAQSTVGTMTIIGLSYAFFLFGERPFLKTAK